MILGSILLFSCNSILVPDPIDPQLPEYTEKGYNVSGAIYNGVWWRSEIESDFFNETGKPTFLADTITDSLLITFSGQTKYQYISFEFHLKGLQIRQYKDLVKLNDTKVILDGNKNFASINYLNDSTPVNNGKGTGQLYFRHITQTPETDDFAGTFGFAIQDENQPIVEVTYGRFDYSSIAFIICNN